jgi:hypothetical protein
MKIMLFVKRYTLVPGLLALTGFFLGACNKQIAAIHPESEIALSGIMGSLSGIQETAVANYSQLAFVQGNWHNLSEFRGNTVSSALIGDENTGDAYNYTQNPLSTVNSLFWQNAYSLIVTVDYTIQGAQAYLAGAGATTLDSTDKATLLHTEGEMYFLRALTYFHLVRLYGRPYYQTPSTNLGVMIKNTPDPTYIPGRSSVQDCYTQIVSDLDSAAICMSAISLNSNVWASKEAAWALLSRVYLYEGGSFAAPVSATNTLAIAYADSVINSGKFSLLTGRASFDTMYVNQNGNSEMIFTTENQDGYLTNTTAGLYTVAVSDTSFTPGNFYVAPSFWNSFDTTSDYRTDFIQWNNGVHVVTKYKFGMLPDYSASTAPTPYLRLGEIYLNRAEAYFKNGNTSACLSDLNVIRTRAGLQPLAGISGSALQDSLVSERRKELCFEADASFDYYRNGLPMTRAAGDFQAAVFTVQPTDNRVVLPLPGSEILSNPKLVQNPM